MQWLKDFVNSFFSSLSEVFLWFLNLLYDGLQYVFYVLFDSLLTVVSLFISALDFSSVVFTSVMDYSSLPPQAIYLINVIGIPQCFTVIGSALLLRMILNLIPASLTRV